MYGSFYKWGTFHINRKVQKHYGFSIKLLLVSVYIFKLFFFFTYFISVTYLIVNCDITRVRMFSW